MCLQAYACQLWTEGTWPEWVCLRSCFPLSAAGVLRRALQNVADEGLLLEGFFWIPSLAGPSSNAANKAVRLGFDLSMCATFVCNQRYTLTHAFRFNHVCNKLRALTHVCIVLTICAICAVLYHMRIAEVSRASAPAMVVTPW